MRVMIIGANYGNKGAQSMLYVTVSEIKRRFPNSEIFFATFEIVDDSNLLFKRLYYTSESKKLALLNGVKAASYNIYLRIKSTTKKVMRKKNYNENLFKLSKIIDSIDIIIDISGFALGDKFTIANQNRYLDNIRLAKKYNIPIYLMPQSFGPFKNTGEEREILTDIKETLQYPNIIFARELEGYDILKNEFGLNNVVLSTDLVLQNSGVKIDEIFKNPPSLSIPIINSGKDQNVALIPNKKSFEHGDQEKILLLYRHIIGMLLDANKKIFIFRHSREDLSICKKLKADFSDNENVVLFDNDFSCFEYDSLINHFAFIICSRYHGIVHAFRNGVPAIALGWAIKYKELLHTVGQDKYVFDITSKNFDLNTFEMALNEMLVSYKKESVRIITIVEEIQNESCFDTMMKDFSNVSNNKND